MFELNSFSIYELELCMINSNKTWKPLFKLYSFNFNGARAWIKLNKWVEVNPVNRRAEAHANSPLFKWHWASDLNNGFEASIRTHLDPYCCKLIRTQTIKPIKKSKSRVKIVRINLSIVIGTVCFHTLYLGIHKKGRCRK